MAIMYFVVNQTARMKPGKVASQVGHAAIELYKRYRVDANTKIVLGATECTLLRLHRLYPQTVLISDCGLTQVEADTITVLGFPVCTDKSTFPELEELKLY